MTDVDPLDDLGLRSCPQCLLPMEPVGDVVEHEGQDGPVVFGSAWWRCPACGMAAIA